MTLETEHPSPEFAAAAVPRRAVAYILDVALLAAILMPVHFALFELLFDGERPGWLAAGIQLELYVLATFSLPVYLYFTLLESSRWQATLGKRWLKIQVADIDQQPIRRPRALVRTIVKLIPWEIAHASALLPTPIYDGASDAALRPGFMVSTMLVGAWLVTVMLTPKSQGVHDLIANTLVLPAPERPR